MKAIIPCAGYATRLYPLTENLPKALLDVKGRPIIEYVIDRICKISEIDELFLVTNNKFFPKFIEWKLTTKLPREISNKIKIINDDTNSNEDRLGTIGDTWKAVSSQRINEDVLVVMGDNLFDFDLRKAKKYFDSINNSLIIVYDVKEKDEAKKFGIVDILGNGKVRAFIEKPKNPSSTLASIGIYFLKKPHLKNIQEYVLDEKLSNDRMGDLIAYLVDKEKIYSLNLQGRWFDIGSKETYNHANEIW